MRILYIVHDYWPKYQAGTENYTHYIAESMADIGYDVFILTTEPQSRNDYKLEKYKEGRVNVIKIHKDISVSRGINSDHNDEKYFTKFIEIFNEVNPNIVHIQHLLYSSIKIVSWMKEKKVPILYTIHDSWLECPRITKLMPDNSMCSGWNADKCRDCINSSKIYISNKDVASVASLIYRKFSKHRIFVKAILLLKKFLSFVDFGKKAAENEIKKRNQNMARIVNLIDLFISPSNYLRNSFVSWGIPENKIIYSRNGMNVFESEVGSVGKNNKQKGGDELIFAFTSFIREAKGVHVLLEAFEILEKKGVKGVKLKVYGRYEEGTQYAANFLKKVKNLSSVEYGGEFNNKEINKILSEIDYLVLPSIWSENAPLVIEEAYLNKVPCIVSNIGGMAERVLDGENGLHFKVGDSSDLAQKISFLLENRKERDKFIKNIPHVKTINENAIELDLLYKKMV